MFWVKLLINHILRWPRICIETKTKHHKYYAKRERWTRIFVNQYLFANEYVVNVWLYLSVELIHYFHSTNTQIQLCTHTDGNREYLERLQNAIYCSFSKFDIRYFIYLFNSYVVSSFIGTIRFDPCMRLLRIQKCLNNLYKNMRHLVHFVLNCIHWTTNGEQKFLQNLRRSKCLQFIKYNIKWEIQAHTVFTWLLLLLFSYSCSVFVFWW